MCVKFNYFGLSPLNELVGWSKNPDVIRPKTNLIYLTSPSKGSVRATGARVRVCISDMHKHPGVKIQNIATRAARG